MDKKGITLISLVITIIIMIIIAGVTIVNITGRNSSISKAQDAKMTEEERSKREVLEQALIKFNSGNSLGTKDLKQFLKTELSLGDADIIKVTDLNGDDAFIICMKKICPADYCQRNK